jgi:hypothetical protein
MCGLFGAVGRGFDLPTVRALAVLNQERGTHSTGLMNSAGAYYKKAVRASEYLATKDINEWIRQHANGDGLYGHTRMASRGAHTDDNAHPFRYEAVTGMHNGILDAPLEYAVDSMYAFHLLSQHEPGEYQEALKEVAGWYVLVWADRRNGCVYFLNWSGDLYFTKQGGVFYYSSDQRHLRAATGLGEVFEVKHRQVYRYDGRRLKKLKDFTGKVRQTKQLATTNWDGGCGGYVGGRGWQAEYHPKYTGDLKLHVDGKWYAEIRLTKPVKGVHGSYHCLDYELVQNQQVCWDRFGPNATPVTWRKIGGKNVAKLLGEPQQELTEDTILEPSEKPLTPSQLEAEIRQIEEELKGEDMLATARAKRRRELKAEGYFDSDIERQLENEGLYEQLIIT